MKTERSKGCVLCHLILPLDITTPYLKLEPATFIFQNNCLLTYQYILMVSRHTCVCVHACLHMHGCVLECLLPVAGSAGVMGHSGYCSFSFCDYLHYNAANRSWPIPLSITSSHSAIVTSILIPNFDNITMYIDNIVVYYNNIARQTPAIPI